ncbi:MAG: TIGR03087 family PEP-CTERM/XrtA system glycosyltransferase [Pseudomonadota bacterium]
MGKPHLLFLAHRIPYPPDKGDKIRSWNILKHLTQRFDIHLGAFVDDPDDRRHEAFLQTMCEDVCLLDLEGGMKRLPRILSGLKDDKPLSVALWEDPHMRDFVNRTIDGGGVDHVFVFSGQMAPYVLKHVNRRRLIMMDFVDIDSDKFRQYAEEAGWPKSMLYRREATLLAQFEKQVSRAVDVSLFVSQAEADLFRRYAGSYGHTVHALDNGVDLDFFDPEAGFAAMTLSGSPSLVMTGAMDYRPNVDAALWTIDEILPLVKRDCPGATFTIVGGKPPAELLAHDGTDGVRVTGRVEDVRPWIAAADISIAPIRIARGVQNKVLEAMAMARPTIATPQAFSGIHARAGTDLMVAESAEDIASDIVWLTQHPDARRTLGRAGRDRMLAGYSWDHQMQELDRIIDRHDAGLKREAA